MREKGKPGSILQRARDSRKSHWHAALQARDGPGASQTGVRGREAPGGWLPAFPGSPAGTEALAFVILGFGAASGLLRQGWMLGPGWPGGVGSPVREPGGRLGLLDGPAVPGAGATGKMPPSRRVRQGWGRPVARRPAVRQPDPRRPARPGACQAGAWTGSESSAAEGQAGHGRARRFLPKRLLKRLLLERLL